jgi:hypothetical protein
MAGSSCYQVHHIFCIFCILCSWPNSWKLAVRFCWMAKKSWKSHSNSMIPNKKSWILLDSAVWSHPHQAPFLFVKLAPFGWKSPLAPTAPTMPLVRTLRTLSQPSLCNYGPYGRTTSFLRPGREIHELMRWPLGGFIWLAGWWWLEPWNGLWLSHHIGKNHPNWRTHMFQRGRYTTNQLDLLKFGVFVFRKSTTWEI